RVPPGVHRVRGRAGAPHPRVRHVGARRAHRRLDLARPAGPGDPADRSREPRDLALVLRPQRAPGRAVHPAGADPSGVPRRPDLAGPDPVATAAMAVAAVPAHALDGRAPRRDGRRRGVRGHRRTGARAPHVLGGDGRGRRARPPKATGLTSARRASSAARAGSRRPAPGTIALAAAAPSARASAERQPSPRSRAVTSPPRNASPLPTGYRPRSYSRATSVSP